MYLKLKKEISPVIEHCTNMYGGGWEWVVQAHAFCHRGDVQDPTLKLTAGAQKHKLLALGSPPFHPSSAQSLKAALSVYSMINVQK